MKEGISEYYEVSSFNMRRSEWSIAANYTQW